MSDIAETNQCLRALRKEAMAPGLHEADLAPDPVVQFNRWLTEALARDIPEPNAMTLATATRDGIPAARVVLLRGFDERGFVFYTNYESQKGRELAENPRAALVFHWPALGRQVRITGTVERVSPEESDAYFRSRPHGSQLGAWASQQSAVIPSREVLEARLQEVEQRFASDEVPRPPFWGGYRVAPATIEFWQSRPNRLHDRLRYVRQPDGTWRIERLSP
ncbi:MAG: pyridoxamine 5'-phosphate oxidase [Sphaerobacter sp.]|nr:pyridoxamine 5'-phosphate oxidase [Sphaerobacter sp.]